MKKHIIAVTAVIKRGDKFILIKRNQQETAYPGKWCLPGGKMEREESILDALKREVKEEVGLEIENEKTLVQDFNFIRPDGINVVGLSFLVKPKPGDVKLGSDFDGFRWISLDELEKFDHIPGIEEAVKIAFDR